MNGEKLMEMAGIKDQTFDWAIPASHPNYGKGIPSIMWYGGDDYLPKFGFKEGEKTGMMGVVVELWRITQLAIEIQIEKNLEDATEQRLYDLFELIKHAALSPEVDGEKVAKLVGIAMNIAGHRIVSERHDAESRERKRWTSGIRRLIEESRGAKNWGEVGFVEIPNGLCHWVEVNGVRGEAEELEDAIFEAVKRAVEQAKEEVPA